jgi:hypothetical protein
MTTGHGFDLRLDRTDFRRLALHHRRHRVTERADDLLHLRSFVNGPEGSRESAVRQNEVGELAAGVDAELGVGPVEVVAASCAVRASSAETRASGPVVAEAGCQARRSGSVTDPASAWWARNRWSSGAPW